MKIFQQRRQPAIYLAQIQIMPKTGFKVDVVHARLLRIKLPWVQIEDIGATGGIGVSAHGPTGHPVGIQTKIPTTGYGHISAEYFQGRKRNLVNAFQGLIPFTGGIRDTIMIVHYRVHAGTVFVTFFQQHIVALCHPWHRDIPYVLYIKTASGAVSTIKNIQSVIGDFNITPCLQSARIELMLCPSHKPLAVNRVTNATNSKLAFRLNQWIPK